MKKRKETKRQRKREYRVKKELGLGRGEKESGLPRLSVQSVQLRRCRVPPGAALSTKQCTAVLLILTSDFKQSADNLKTNTSFM